MLNCQFWPGLWKKCNWVTSVKHCKSIFMSYKTKLYYFSVPLWASRARALVWDYLSLFNEMCWLNPFYTMVEMYSSSYMNMSPVQRVKLSLFWVLHQITHRKTLDMISQVNIFCGMERTVKKRFLSFSLCSLSSYLGGYEFVSVFELSLLRQPHSIVGIVFVHALYISI